MIEGVGCRRNIPRLDKVIELLEPFVQLRGTEFKVVEGGLRRFGSRGIVDVDLEEPGLAAYITALNKNALGTTIDFYNRR